MGEKDFDVVVVGASIAGCTAATLFARRGARVALIESHADPAAYKRSCTHMIQSSANGVLDRLGVAGALEAAGGVRTTVETWTELGWIVDGGWRRGERPAGRNLCVRRSVLDPLLRQAAAQTPGVEAMLGWRVTALAVEAGAVCGAEAQATNGRSATLRAALVVGADGRGSTVAELAGVPCKVAPNERGAYFAYYRDLPLATAEDSQVWLQGTTVAYAFPADAGLTLLAAFPAHERLDEFKRDREAGLEATFADLPRAPDPASGERVSPVQGRIDLDNVLEAHHHGVGDALRLGRRLIAESEDAHAPSSCFS